MPPRVPLGWGVFGFHGFWHSWQFSGAPVRRFVECGSLGIYRMFFHPKTWVISFYKMDHRDRVLFLPHFLSPWHWLWPTVSSPSSVRGLIFLLYLSAPLSVLCSSPSRSEESWSAFLRMVLLHGFLRILLHSVSLFHYLLINPIIHLLQYVARSFIW